LKDESFFISLLSCCPSFYIYVLRLRLVFYILLLNRLILLLLP